MIDVAAQVMWDWSQWAAPLSERWWQETLCSVLVGVACGVLGCFVVLRRMALIGDALSHAVLPGVVIAFMLTGSTGIAGLFLGALIAGITTALLIRFVSQHSRTKEDSAIGIVFTAFFALGVILISSMGRGTHFDLKCFLFGDPLAVGRQDLIMMSVVAPIVILTIVALYHPLRLASFDPTVAAAMGMSVAKLHYLLMGLLSATVVAGLKTTGVVLVVAMVITPASAAYQLANRLWSMLLLSAAFGAVAAAVGMSVAFVTNSPTGPAMVLVATLIFALTMIFSPRHGLAMQAVRRWRAARHFHSEDVLKSVYNLSEQPGALCAVEDVARRTGLSVGRVGRLAAELKGRQLLDETEGQLRLTEAGRRQAIEMVRSHRLWETYLADRARIEADEIHAAAERLEHAHELADEIAQTLGHPSHDPHGEVIPPPESRGPNP